MCTYVSTTQNVLYRTQLHFNVQSNFIDITGVVNNISKVLLFKLNMNSARADIVDITGVLL